MELAVFVDVDLKLSASYHSSLAMLVESLSCIFLCVSVDNVKTPRESPKRRVVMRTCFELVVLVKVTTLAPNLTADQLLDIILSYLYLYQIFTLLQI